MVPRRIEKPPARPSAWPRSVRCVCSVLRAQLLHERICNLSGLSGANGLLKCGDGSPGRIPRKAVDRTRREASVGQVNLDGADRRIGIVTVCVTLEEVLEQTIIVVGSEVGTIVPPGKAGPVMRFQRADQLLR